MESRQEGLPMQASLLYTTIGLAKREDLDAFLKLYDAYVYGVFDFVFRRSGDLEIAQDITAETFVRAYEVLHSYHPEHGSAFELWLLKQAFRELYEHYRDHSQHVSEDVVNEIYLELTDENQLLYHKLTFEQLNTLLGAMHSWEATSFDLMYIANKTPQDIAYVIDQSTKKVQKHITSVFSQLSFFLGQGKIIENRLKEAVIKIATLKPETRLQCDVRAIKSLVTMSIQEGRLMHTKPHQRLAIHLSHLAYQPINKKAPWYFLGIMLIGGIISLGVAIQYSTPASILFGLDKKFESFRFALIRDEQDMMMYRLSQIQERMSEYQNLRSRVQSYIPTTPELEQAKKEVNDAIYQTRIETVEILQEYSAQGIVVPSPIQKLSNSIDLINTKVEQLFKTPERDTTQEDDIFHNLDINGYIGR